MIDLNRCIDIPCDLPYRKVLTTPQLNIPGLATFGYQSLNKAIPPIVLHYHQNCIEIVYVTKGHVIFYVDNHPYHVYGGNAFIVPPNILHSSGNQTFPSCEMFWLQIDLTNLPFLNLDSTWSFDLSQKLYIEKPKVIRCPDESKILIKSAFDHLYTFPDKPPYSAATKIITFLYSLLENHNSDFSFSEDIHSSVNYILDHLHEDLKLEDLANLCHLSLSRFKYKFKQQIGMTPGEFINSHKIRLAKIYLLETPHITEVAFKLGFSTSSYFSVVFKRFTNLSPREYLQKHHQSQDVPLTLKD